jgi:hypothetical protein
MKVRFFVALALFCLFHRTLYAILIPEGVMPREMKELQSFSAYLEVLPTKGRGVLKPHIMVVEKYNIEGVSLCMDTALGGEKSEGSRRDSVCANRRYRYVIGLPKEAEDVKVNFLCSPMVCSGNPTEERGLSTDRKELLCEIAPPFLKRGNCPHMEVAYRLPLGGAFTYDLGPLSKWDALSIGSLYIHQWEEGTELVECAPGPALIEKDKGIWYKWRLQNKGDLAVIKCRVKGLRLQ